MKKESDWISTQDYFFILIVSSLVGLSVFKLGTLIALVPWLSVILGLATIGLTATLLSYLYLKIKEKK